MISAGSSPPLPAQLTQLTQHTLRALERRSEIAPYKRRGWLVRRMLLLADIVGLAVAFTMAEVLVGAPAGHDPFPYTVELALFLLTLPVWVLVAKIYGLYDRDEERAAHSTADEFKDVVHLVTLSTWALFAGSHLTSFAEPSLARLATFWFAAITCIPMARALARSWARGRLAYLQNTIVVGAGNVGQELAVVLLRHPEYGLNLVGFVDSEPRELREELDHVAVLGGIEELPELVPLLDVERVVIAFSSDGHEDALDLVRALQDHRVQIDIVPRLFDVIGPGMDMHALQGVPLIALAQPSLSRSSRFVKRAFDLLAATFGLALLAPLFLVVALAVKLDSRGPVFFRQLRVGAGGSPFYVYKFRTMVKDADEHKQELAHLNLHLLRGDPRMFKIENDPRVTRVGRVLRRYFLDEFPQLINVAMGEMSLIGPRPLILEEAQYVENWGEKRLDLKPGMTGLWQVLGRSTIPFAEMVRLDYLYVTTWSLGNDIRLLLRTLPLVLRGERAV